MRASQARTLVVLIAVASALAARLIEHFALGDVPHVMDEIAYLFEAKVMATGHLTAPVVAPRAAFNMWFVDDRTARFAIFPPGWPCVLAVGARLGLAHWVNPGLHLATVILVGRAGARLGARGPAAAATSPRAQMRSARLSIGAALLYAATPQTLILAASLMAHTLVALCASVVVWVIATLLGESEPTRRDAKSRSSMIRIALGGAAVGIAIATRPLCGLVIGIPFLAIVAVGGGAPHVGAGAGSEPARPSEKSAWRHLLVMLAAMAPFVFALGAFNRVLTGSMLRFPQSAYFDEHLPPANVPFFTYGKGCNTLGFGHACDHTVRDATHTVYSALTDAGDNLRAWMILVGPLVFVGAGLAIVRKQSRGVALWLVAPPLLAIALYGLYWQAGVCYGARFYHAALPALVLACVVGLASLQSLATTAMQKAKDDRDARERNGDGDGESESEGEVEKERRGDAGGSNIFAGALAFALLFDVIGYTVALRELRSWSWWGTDDRFAKLAEEWHDHPKEHSPNVTINETTNVTTNDVTTANHATTKRGAVVMVAFGRDDVTNPELYATASMGRGGWLLGIRSLAALAQNEPDPDLREIVFAKFHPALVPEIAMRFPDRDLWLYTAWADRSQDVLEPWSPSMFADHVYRMPADNFDGFRIGRPNALPDPLFREPTEEGWPLR